MKILELRRATQNDEVTLGIFVDPKTNLPICLSLELPWKNNQRSISCIPEGTYICEPYSSSKYTNVYEIKDVEGRSKILIHVGNTTDDIEGCICTGTYFGSHKGKPAVLDSRKAFNVFRDYVGALDRFVLTIKDVK